MNANELAKQKCVPCRGGTPPLTADKVKEYLAAVPQVAGVAEEQGHHPDIHIHWNKVELELWTHAIGGLHENDFVMAARTDRLV